MVWGMVRGIAWEMVQGMIWGNGSGNGLGNGLGNGSGNAHKKVFLNGSSPNEFYCFMTLYISYVQRNFSINQSVDLF